ncbi:hypothetical protein ES702_03993 [subsurface metagenome]
MQEVRFWVNDKQHKEAISKLGDKAELYGFAKDAFLSKLKGVKEVKKEVWYVCPNPLCKVECRRFVRAEIEKGTGKLIPICESCGRGLVRRVERVAN